METIVITEHAYSRAKERLSLNAKSFNRLAITAFEKGLKHCETKGRLKRYIDSLWFKHKTASNIRIYGENIFFFAGSTLITVHQLSTELKKHVKYQKQ